MGPITLVRAKLSAVIEKTMSQALACNPAHLIASSDAFEDKSSEDALEIGAAWRELCIALPTRTVASIDSAQQLLRWAEGRGCDLSSVCVRFSQEFRCRGLFATAPIRRGDVVLRMSKCTTISLQTCYSAVPALEKHRVAEFSAFSFFLMRCMQQCESADGASPSFWAPYFACLPTLEEIGNALSTAIDEQTTPLAPEYIAAISAARRRAAASLQYLQETLKETMSDDDLYRLRYAMAIMFSRALSVNGRTMLIPVVDLMNHRIVGAGACRMSHDAHGRLIIVANKDIAVDEELCLYYGDKSLPELLACYGIRHSADIDTRSYST